MQKTLHEFQISGGIPFDQQILLLDNPQLLKGYFPCIRAYDLPSKPNLPQRAVRYLNRKLGRDVVLPPAPQENLFAGYIHRSFEDTALLNKLYEKIANCSERPVQSVDWKK